MKVYWPGTAGTGPGLVPLCGVAGIEAKCVLAPCNTGHARHALTNNPQGVPNAWCCTLDTPHPKNGPNHTCLPTHTCLPPCTIASCYTRGYPIPVHHLLHTSCPAWWSPLTTWPW